MSKSSQPKYSKLESHPTLYTLTAREQQTKTGTRNPKRAAAEDILLIPVPCRRHELALNKSAQKDKNLKFVMSCLDSVFLFRILRPLRCFLRQLTTFFIVRFAKLVQSIHITLYWSDRILKATKTIVIG